MQTDDVEALTVLPRTVVWCAKSGSRSELRTTSWSLVPWQCQMLCCHNFSTCQRVANALCRPQVTH